MTLTREKVASRAPLMPMLFSLGQHNALRPVQVGLQERELIFAYLDDVYFLERVSAIFAILQEELWGDTPGVGPVWKCLVACDVLDRAARALDPEFTTVWRGGGVPRHCDLGTPLGHEDFVRAQLEHIVVNTTFPLSLMMSSPLGHCCCIVPMFERIMLFA